MMISIYPSISANKDLNKLIQSYPEAMKGFMAFGGPLDYSTGAGYLGIELFSIMVPLLLLVAAVSAGARALAGEEEDGTLDLLLSYPLSRSRLVLEKGAALILELTLLSSVLFVSLWIGARAANMGVSAANLFAATVDALLLAFVFGALALAAGALSGRRGVASATSAGVAVASYLLNALAPIASPLRAVRSLSPFYHYAAPDPLRRGLSLAHSSLLLASALVLLAFAVWAFRRRELAS
jgi:ABC-2 type transport system permease protein